MRIALANFTRRAGVLLASAALVFAAVFVFSSGATAASVQKKPAASVAVAAKTAAPVAQLPAVKKPLGMASAAKGLNTGIKVHGHWTLVVKNADGSVAKHVEFENTLQTDGGTDLISGLISGQYAIGTWTINFGSGGTVGPCSTNSVIHSPCNIVQPTASDLAAGCSASLAQVSPQPFCYATLTRSLSPQHTFILSGQAFVDTTTTINTVDTFAVYCEPNGPSTGPITPSTVSPSSCLAGTSNSNGEIFTLASSTSTPPAFAPVNVTAGQTVTVTVQFSFS